jgi:hypothetical protein
MTELGVIQLLSLIYISAVICLSISVNENRDPRRIVRETLRRWAKFLGVTLAGGGLVSLLSSV